MNNDTEDDDLDIDVDSDLIDDQALGVAIKGDGNEINNMITDLYKSNLNMNTTNKESNETNDALKKKSNLKTNLSNTVNQISNESGLNKSPIKRVHFNDFRQEKL